MKEAHAQGNQSQGELGTEVGRFPVNAMEGFEDEEHTRREIKPTYATVVSGSMVGRGSIPPSRSECFLEEGHKNSGRDPDFQEGKSTAFVALSSHMAEPNPEERNPADEMLNLRDPIGQFTPPIVQIDPH